MNTILKGVLIACAILLGVSDTAALPMASSGTNTELRASAIDKDEIRAFIEGFCRKYYNSCFSGRTYVENSVRVNNISHISSSQMKVEGRHSYRGRFGLLYSDHRFYALVRVSSSGNVSVEFNKESAPDLFHEDYYWEKCTKVIN